MAGSLAIVEPDTVVRWHRAGFRVYWNWLSRRGQRSGRPSLREVRALIRRMATENSWGAPRIHGELLRLGFEVPERSVSRQNGVAERFVATVRQELLAHVIVLKPHRRPDHLHPARVRPLDELPDAVRDVPALRGKSTRKRPEPRAPKPAARPNPAA